MPTRNSRRGFTFVELAVTMSIISVVLLALGSVLVVSAKALPTEGVTDSAVPAAASVDTLMSDLRFATSVTESTPTAITFTVADRDADGSAETIRYAWSGINGDPLTRRYNNGAVVNVVPSVSNFDLRYVKQVHTTTQTTSSTWDSGEVLLSSFNGWSGLLGLASTNNLSTTNWAAEAFQIDRVALPANTTRVAITRVTLKLKKPPSGTVGGTVEIHLPSAAGASTPAAAALGTPYSVPAASLSMSFGWVDATFSDVVFTNNSTTDLVLVVKGTAPSSMSLQYLNALLAPLDNSMYRATANSGGTWTPSSGLNSNDAPYFVYGSYQYPLTTTTSVDAYNLTSVAISLQPTGGAPRVDAAIETMNAPSVPGP